MRAATSQVAMGKPTEHLWMPASDNLWNQYEFLLAMASEILHLFSILKNKGKNF